MNQDIQVINGQLKVLNQKLPFLDIPDNVTQFTDKCFEGCTNISVLYIPNSVNMIGNSWFSGFSILQSINHTFTRYHIFK
jgi:hypothetical protein